MSKNDNEVTEAKAGDLIPDIANANQHTPRGEDMVQRSIQKHGFRFAGTLDKNNGIVHGNNRHEKAGAIGLEDVVIVKADPNKQYYLQFDDLDLADGDNPAREIAYLANRTAQVSIEFDPEQVVIDSQAGVDFSEMFFQDEFLKVVDDLEIITSLPTNDTRDDNGGLPPDEEKDLIVKPVLRLSQVSLFEEAIQATGKKDRGSALLEICGYYIDNEKR